MRDDQVHHQSRSRCRSPYTKQRTEHGLPGGYIYLPAKLITVFHMLLRLQQPIVSYKYNITYPNVFFLSFLLYHM